MVTAAQACIPSVIAGVQRWVRRHLHGRYRDIGDHFVHVEFESFGHYESQGQVRYRCIDCGEEHRRESSFSANCGDGTYNTGGDTITGEAVVTNVTDRYVWVRPINVAPEDKISVRLPRYHSEYDTDLEQQLNAVQTGEYYEVTFVAENADRTAWYCGELHPLE